MVAEQLRRILLKEMGITSWFPRVPLPGAALSHEQCLQIFLEESAVSEKPEPRSETSPDQGVAQLAELLGKKPARAETVRTLPDVEGPARVARIPHTIVPVEPTPPHAQTPPAASAPTVDQPADADAFGFSWFNVDKRLAVLAMLPAGNSRLTSSCRQMLTRMLAALHAPWQSLELSDHNFHWPFADDLGLPADAAAARQAVDGFIARRLREQNCAMLLVLCDDLPWFLNNVAAQSLNTSSDSEEATRLRVHRQFGFAMLATHSLHAMEKDAGLKREAWQAMQLLRERLNRNH